MRPRLALVCALLLLPASGASAARPALSVPEPGALPAPLAQAPGTPLAPVTVRECGAAPLPRSGPAARFNALWRRSGPGWTGGDGTYSVALPDGRIAWVFGDTFVGGVTGGERSDRGLFSHNSLVIQDGPCLTTHTGAVAGQPAAFAEPGTGFYWPNQPFLEGGMLRIPFTRVLATGPLQWQFAPTDETDLLSYDLQTFALRSIRALPPGVAWGSDTAQAGAFSYVFGVGADDSTMRVARAPRGEIATAPWTFWDGRRWTEDQTASAPVLTGVGAQMSVVKLGRRWIAVSQARLWDPHVYAYVASRPQGPYGPPRLLAELHPPPNTFTYNAVLHPDLGRAGGYLLSTNVNTTADLFLTKAAYNQPLFTRVDLRSVR